MAGRKYLLILLTLLCFGQAHSQQLDFAKVDSTSYALYQQGNWHQLIIYGQKAVAAGTDFTLLRLRLAYAYFRSANYGAAIIEYQEVLRHDSHNAIARQYALLCNQYLNQDAQAAYHASFLDTGTLHTLHLSPFGLVQAELETGVKVNDNYYRGSATYNRFGLSNRLGWRLQLDQSIAYYSEPIHYYQRDDDDDRNTTTYRVLDNSFHQLEYYGKLTYTLTTKWAIYGGYHYTYADYAQIAYNNNIAFAALSYTGKILKLQADASVGRINNYNVDQYNAEAALFPKGNLNLYFISRVSSLQQDNGSNFLYSQTAGGKIFKNFWLDGNVTLGKMNNYLDEDALYLYNSIDVTRFKAGAGGYYQLGKHALVYVNYNYQQKRDFYQHITFNQYSITGGIRWKF